jgi:L-threonylcarbamoyladenylate synthase
VTGPRPALLQPEDLDAVAVALVAGEVVGLPTDTVYGLGVVLEARPTGRLFALKGRPPGLALPVLVGERGQVDRVASSFPPAAVTLAERFWPGPLTLVVPAKRAVGQLLGGNRRTVGVRWPASPFLEELCLLVGPLAVTSANRHGEPPATSADEVLSAFGRDEVVAVVAGAVPGGLPSSVVDCAARIPSCLREGAISWPELEAVLPG